MSILGRALQAYQKDLEAQRREAERRRREEIEVEVQRLRRTLQARLGIEVGDDQITVRSASVYVTVVEPAGEVTFFTRRYPGAVTDDLYASVRCAHCGLEYKAFVANWSDLGWIVQQRMEHERSHQKQTNAPARG